MTTKSTGMKYLGADPERMMFQEIADAFDELRTNWSEGGSAQAHYRDKFVELLIKAKLISPLSLSIETTKATIVGLDITQNACTVTLRFGTSGVPKDERFTIPRSHAALLVANLDKPQAARFLTGRGLYVDEQLIEIPVNK